MQYFLYLHRKYGACREVQPSVASVMMKVLRVSRVCHVQPGNSSRKAGRTRCDAPPEAF